MQCGTKFSFGKQYIISNKLLHNSLHALTNAALTHNTEIIRTISYLILWAE